MQAGSVKLLYRHMTERNKTDNIGIDLYGSQSVFLSGVHCHQNLESQSVTCPD